MSISRCRVFTSVFAIAGIVFCFGCGSSETAGTVAVSGLVTLDGSPVSEASVAFIGNEGARLASAQTDKSGSFTVRAAPGTNVVTVSKQDASSVVAPTSEEDNLMPDYGEYQKMQANKPKDLIPAKYSDPKTSGLAFEIKDGMPKVELALSSK